MSTAFSPSPQSGPASQTERAYQRLRDELLRGVLMPGDRLTVADLQDRFGLGLTPIREALTRLAGEGLVESETHRGARVALASPSEFADLMATRRTIERLCLIDALERGDATWEAELMASCHLLARTPLPSSAADLDAAATWERQHRRFHAALVSACGSAWLLKFWNTLADHSERYRKLRLLHGDGSGADARDVGAEHQALMEAAVARDRERLVRLIDAHLRATETAMARFLKHAIPNGAGP